MNKESIMPKKLNECPLVDALIEIRFISELDKNAVFGYIYSLLRNDYSGPVVNLPLSQIPIQIREHDPNLQYKPLYRIDGKDTVLQLGSDVICISSKIPYIGWDALSSKAEKIFTKLVEQRAVKTVIRLGHRYVNFFEGNIDSKLELTVHFVPGYSYKNIQIRSEIQEGNFMSTLQYSNSASYQPEQLSQQLLGSIIDIDTFRVYDGDYFIQNIRSEIDQAHEYEKRLFYSLLKNDFIDQLNPEY